ncbi:DUF4148 domain-containing protein [Paucibacter sp. M5-1]|uniref:DUF4148 domain-containing protein n=1 Tax=Paucibacter sp. M5-1 TaxID=3015998 RepID=UPI0022B8FBC0|nr:DUF4148 domain-containing protein [Paucibacter sp. M5-1]MCZ7884096.1 DUF4148 domain-containing protein [Paucibacter sp. M5-1]
MSKSISSIALSVIIGTVFSVANVHAQTQDRPLTRAEVIAELVEARSSGELQRLHSEGGSYGSLELNSRPSTVSRSSVIAELERARSAGELKHAFRESGSYLPDSVRATSTLTREQVKAELERARRSGEFARLNSNNSHFAL